MPFDPIEYCGHFAETETVFLESVEAKGRDEIIDFFVQLVQMYSRDIWLLFLNVVLVIMLLLFIIRKWRKISREVKFKLNAMKVLSHLSSMLWQLLRIPVNQPDIQFKKYKARIIVLSFLIMILFTNIMALNLLGTTLVVHEEYTLKSFGELLTKPNYFVHWLSNSYLLPRFVNAKDPDNIFFKIYRQFKRNNSIFEMSATITDIGIKELFTKSGALLIEEEFFMSFMCLFACSAIVNKDLQLRKTVIKGLRTRFAYGYNKRIDPVLRQWLNQA